jgi:two-component system sensor histidine kinase/response regulator
MPELDGIETTRRLKADPRHRELPIIALTAHAMADDRERFLSAGMDDYLSKPIEEAELVRVLKRWLATEDAESELSQDEVSIEPDVSPAANGGAHPRAPVIAGVDVAAALARVNGNLPLLQRLLGEFIERHGDAASAIKHCIRTGEFAQVAIDSHTIKGAAATLGAMSVATAAGAVETSVRAGLDASSSVERLADALAELGQADLGAAARTPPAKTSDSETRRALLTRLREQLQGNDLGARESANLLAPMSGMEDCVPDLAQLIEPTQSLDYERALQALERLQLRLQSSQEST